MKVMNLYAQGEHKVRSYTILCKNNAVSFSYFVVSDGACWLYRGTNMKIAIITFHFPINYGALLQAYALSKCLESMGHDVEFIDYQPDYHVKLYQWRWKYCGLHPVNLIFSLLRKRFLLFRNIHLKLSNRLYRSYRELSADPPKADAYMCGSDQIWNPDITNFDASYFLGFVPAGMKRIAYAGSFGKTELTFEQQERLKPFFRNIDYLSVREVSGASLINRTCRRKAEVVVDPTLLLDDYEKIVEPPPGMNRYILVINLLNDSLLNQTADFISRELSLPKIILNSYSLKFWELKGKRVFPGPGGYLGLIKHANYVVTNSFHGTVFSIVFMKSFITTALSGHSRQKNTRLIGFLNSVDLAHNYLETFSELRIMDLLASTNDWHLVKSRVKQLRKESLSFLKSSLTDGVS